MNQEESGPTPPIIVARAEDPPAALGAFIAQELEHWGFTCRPVQSENHKALAVRVEHDPNFVLYVTVEKGHGR